MDQALYRQWRPHNWDQVVGQDHVVRTLRNAVQAERIAHAYLFSGPRGTGKTTVARVLAKAVNCTHADPQARPCNACDNCHEAGAGRFLDLIEIDAASNTSVEDVRELRDRINFAPNKGRYKVYIVDEVHMLSTAAFNALLKTLEEPPPHAIFVLATTEVHKIPATVLSRCQRHEFRRLPVGVIDDYLKMQVEAAGMAVDRAVTELIARQATGSLRDAISLLDQLVSTGDRVTLPLAMEVLGIAGGEAVTGIVRSVVERQVGEGLGWINRALDAGADPRQLARQVVEFLRGMLMVRSGNPDLVDVAAEVRQVMASWAESMSLADMLTALRSFSRAATENRGSWQPGLPLELALVEATRGRTGEAGGTAAAAVERRTVPASGDRPPKTVAPPEKVEKAAYPSSAPSKSSVAEPAGPEGSAGFQRVLDLWREILRATYQRDPRAQALLNSCKPLGLEKGRLVLGFSSDLLREKMEKGPNLECVREALREVTGMDLGVRCVLAKGGPTPHKGSAQPDNPSVASPVEDGGIVATAVRDLGAQVVDIRPLPPEGNA
jgi:DNA polymerase-3 subunit gamma/tau